MSALPICILCKEVMLGVDFLKVRGVKHHLFKCRYGHQEVYTRESSEYVRSTKVKFCQVEGIGGMLVVMNTREPYENTSTYQGPDGPTPGRNQQVPG